MASLQDIQLEIQNILDAEDQITDDELKVKVMDYLDDLTQQRYDKIDGIGFYIRSQKAQVEFLKEEEERLKNKRKTIENKITGFKDYISFIMHNHEIKKLSGNHTSIYKKPTSSVIIKDANKLPEEFVKREEIVTPDKRAIKNAIKKGDTFEGAYLYTNESLVIK